MDEQTLARLKRAAGPKPTGPAGLDSPRVVRRSDLVAAITELEHCADGTAFDVEDDEPATPASAGRRVIRAEPAPEYYRPGQGFGGRA